MGERLVVEIKRNHKQIATAYYHWSAYTLPAINIVSSMYEHVLSKSDAMTDDELQLAMVRFAECTMPHGYVGTDKDKDEAMKRVAQAVAETPEKHRAFLSSFLLAHGGLSVEDREYFESKFPNEVLVIENLSRNEGLIAISEEQMQRDINMAQGIVTIDLTEKRVLFSMMYDYDIEQYLQETEDYEDDDFLAPEGIPKSPVDLGEFALEDIELVTDVLRNADEEWIRYENTIYQFISG